MTDQMPCAYCIYILYKTMNWVIGQMEQSTQQLVAWFFWWSCKSFCKIEPLTCVTVWFPVPPAVDKFSHTWTSIKKSPPGSAAVIKYYTVIKWTFWHFLGWSAQIIFIFIFSSPAPNKLPRYTRNVDGGPEKETDEYMFKIHLPYCK